ncbi:hypothetical protein Tco_1017005 [Tanacetum coccineum]|uniref:Uncharacterized protein n=1 Tax=Tanacetum coccineum TaxID=301880 RepID=A0ABQ5FQ91_9ASTR
MKAADYGHVKWIEDKVPRSIWSLAQVVYDKHAYSGTYHWGPKHQRFYGYATNMETSKDVYSRHRIIAVTSHKIMKFFGYKHLEEITVRRQDDQLYKFREGDFKRLRRQDIEDMLLLLVQDDMDRNCLMCTDELHKFSDNTLNHVHIALNDIATRIQMEFYTSARNPIKEILLKLNLPDHRILKDGGEGMNMSVQKSQVHKMAKRDYAWLMISSAAHDKYYEFEDISATDSHVTQDSSRSDIDEEKEDKTNDFDDSDMDLSNDEPKGDDDAAGFGVSM